jgi:hypothetical protein
MIASTLRHLAAPCGLLLALAAAPAPAWVVPCEDDGNLCTADFIHPTSQQCVHPCNNVIGRCDFCNAGRCVATTLACRCAKAYRCPVQGMTIHTPDGRVVAHRDDPAGPDLLYLDDPIPPLRTYHMLIVEPGPSPMVALQSTSSGRYWTILPGGVLAAEAEAVGALETFAVRDAGTGLPRFVLQAADGRFVRVDASGLLVAGAGWEGAARFSERCVPW